MAQDRIGGFPKRLFGMLVFCLFFVAVLPKGGIGGQYTEFDKQVYYSALQDAANALPHKISNQLLAIVPWWDKLNNIILHQGQIQWEGNPGQSRILVVAFMSRQSYESYYMDHFKNRRNEDYVLQKSLWVTVVPELQNFFLPGAKALTHPPPPPGSCPPSPMRIIQLLGLNPVYDYDILLEMWVHPKDLFRPTPDPEVYDHEAELAYKDSLGNWIFPTDWSPFTKFDDTALHQESAWSAASTYRQWFSNRADTIYKVGSYDDMRQWGFPWTRLGYTYDWGSADDHFGLSEFVIRLNPENGGQVQVKLERAIDSASAEWDQYFRCWPQQPFSN